MTYYRAITEFYKSLEQNPTFLGVDYGARKVGLSFSNENNNLALPLDIITNLSVDQTIDKIINIIENRNICGLIVGYPIETSGNEGKTCKNVVDFCDKLLARKDIAIYLQDERFSTKLVGRFMRNTNTKTKRKNQIEDKLAAANILQTALDQINNLKLL